MRGAVIVLALALAGCGGVELAPPVLPVALCADPEPEPVGPVISIDQEVSSDVASIRALGPDLALALKKFRDVDHPAWGRRQAERLKEARRICTR